MWSFALSECCFFAVLYSFFFPSDIHSSFSLNSEILDTQASYHVHKVCHNANVVHLIACQLHLQNCFHHSTAFFPCSLALSKASCFGVMKKF
jgi:hypothetical protein